MSIRMIVGAGLAALFLTTGGAVAQQAVTMTDLAKNPDGFVGKKVVIAECLMMSYNDIVGAQCSTAPMNADILAYVDVGTLNAAGKKLGADCNTTDFNNFCLLKVTGDVAKDGRGKALIKNATLEMVKRTKAF